MVNCTQLIFELYWSIIFFPVHFIKYILVPIKINLITLCRKKYNFILIDIISIKNGKKKLSSSSPYTFYQHHFSIQENIELKKRKLIHVTYKTKNDHPFYIGSDHCE